MTITSSVPLGSVASFITFQRTRLSFRLIGGTSAEYSSIPHAVLHVGGWSGVTLPRTSVDPMKNVCSRPSSLEPVCCCDQLVSSFLPTCKTCPFG